MIKSIILISLSLILVAPKAIAKPVCTSSDTLTPQDQPQDGCDTIYGDSE